MGCISLPKEGYEMCVDVQGADRWGQGRKSSVMESPKWPFV